MKRLLLPRRTFVKILCIAFVVGSISLNFLLAFGLVSGLFYEKRLSEEIDGYKKSTENIKKYTDCISLIDVYKIQEQKVIMLSDIQKCGEKK